MITSSSSPLARIYTQCASGVAQRVVSPGIGEFIGDPSVISIYKFSLGTGTAHTAPSVPTYYALTQFDAGTCASTIMYSLLQGRNPSYSQNCETRTGISSSKVSLCSSAPYQSIITLGELHKSIHIHLRPHSHSLKASLRRTKPCRIHLPV